MNPFMVFLKFLKGEAKYTFTVERYSGRDSQFVLKMPWCKD